MCQNNINNDDNQSEAGEFLSTFHKLKKRELNW